MILVAVDMFSGGTFFKGDFFFLLVTWVHSSSSLSGSFPVSVSGFSFVGIVIFVVVVIVVAVVVVIGVTVVLVVF